MNTRKIAALVIIPAYNEQENLAKTIDEVRANVPLADVLVVSDGSTDETPNIARLKDAKVLCIPFNLGIGGAVQTGLKYALRNNYAVAIQVDADGQHDVKAVNRLIEVLTEHNADIVIGSRNLDDKQVRTPLVRRLGIRYFSQLTRWGTGENVTDCSSGLRALSRRAIRLFAENYPVDFPDAEALILAHGSGLRILEVPVRFRERKSGKSNLSILKLLYYPVKETLAITRTVLERDRERQGMEEVSE